MHHLLYTHLFYTLILYNHRLPTTFLIAPFPLSGPLQRFSLSLHQLSLTAVLVDGGPGFLAFQACGLGFLIIKTVLREHISIHSNKSCTRNFNKQTVKLTFKKNNPAWNLAI